MTESAVVYTAIGLGDEPGPISLIMKTAPGSTSFKHAVDVVFVHTPGLPIINLHYRTARIRKMQKTIHYPSFSDDEETGVLAADEVDNLSWRHGIRVKDAFTWAMREARRNGDESRFPVVVVDDQGVLRTQAGPEEVADILNVMGEAQARRNGRELIADR